MATFGCSVGSEPGGVSEAAGVELMALILADRAERCATDSARRVADPPGRTAPGGRVELLSASDATVGTVDA
ncbi:hypothetical protein GCM10020369_13530 [Cryptosporangium minutisporangium]|uniref:Uncharacterized protein n=1 Tax=Cryptosporangium minutisporangium TaxID=113569 RepID=A0ABP6ST39_9ACTN